MKQALVVLAVLGALLAPSTVNAQSAQQKADVRAALTAKFNTYPKPMTKAQQGEMLNAVAAQFPGWKLLGKKSGNNCPMPNGTLISCDYLVYGPTVTGFDVIGSEGAPDARITGPAGDGEDMHDAIANGSRTLEDPVGSAPGGGGTTPPPANTELEERVSDLEEQVANQKMIILALDNRLAAAEAKLAAQQGDIDALKNGMAETYQIAVDAKALAESLKGFLLSHPIPDGCRVQILGCRLTFNAPPLEK